jgi:hypothetical protein
MSKDIRPAYRRKKTHKGQKCIRGIPVNNRGGKKENITLSLTPEAQEILKELATKLNCSRSDIIERLLRIANNLSDVFNAISKMQ